MKTKIDAELQATADGLKESYAQPGAHSKGPGFKPGHQKLGGRKPGSQNKRTRQAIEICESLNFHPAAFLATIALTGLMPNPNGSTTPVSTEDRLKAALGLAPFVMPKLQATQISGNPDAPIATDAGFNINVILANEDMLAAAQKLSIEISEASMKPQPTKLPPGSHDLDHAGHWKE